MWKLNHKWYIWISILFIVVYAITSLIMEKYVFNARHVRNGFAGIVIVVLIKMCGGFQLVATNKEIVVLNVFL
jgi:hypothetical protein